LAVNHLFAGIAVADYHAALAWYQRLLGRSPDVIVNENEAMWQVASAGWIYVVGDVGRAGSALLTLLVDDLEEQIAALAERGLAAGEIDTLPGGVRKATIFDPEGNTITFGEVPVKDD
jgi:catechol 2,3-dioxygenase-like lactoylglutathione lyase family enzyme